MDNLSILLALMVLNDGSIIDGVEAKSLKNFQLLMNPAIEAFVPFP